MNTPYLRTGLFLAALFTAIAFMLQPGPACMMGEYPPTDTGDLHVYGTYGTPGYNDRPKVELPTFPGCNDPDYEQRVHCSRSNLNRYLVKHMNKRPVSNKKGRVKLAYTIDLNGMMTAAEVINDADPVLAGETMRLIGLMQGQNLRWNPGKIDGELAETTVLLQVSYGLRCESCSGLDEEIAITWVPELY